MRRRAQPGCRPVAPLPARSRRAEQQRDVDQLEELLRFVGEADAIEPRSRAKPTSARRIPFAPLLATNFRKLFEAGGDEGGDLRPNANASLRSSNLPNVLIRLVEPDGIEPTTSSMPLKRSPN